MSRILPFRAVVVLALALACFVGCSSSSTSAPAQKVVHISNKDFTEQLVLSAMITITLEAKGYQVVNSFTPKLSTTEVRNSLIQGEIDLYPEYTGTALTTFFNETDPQTLGDPALSVAKARDDDQKANNIVWGEPTKFNNTWAYALRKSFATAHNLTSLTELIAYAKANSGQLKFLSSNEFYKRKNDGVLAMLAAYGATDLNDSVLIPYPDDKNGTVYKFFSEHKDDPGPPEYAVMVFGTDSQVAQYDLVVMNDDKKFWPNYAAAITVRGEFDAANPDVLPALNAFMTLLDTTTMSELNRQVDFDNKTPEEVARAWLTSKGLVK